MHLASKSEFAALINVSPGRVSQFIASGQISQAAIIGSGQRAKIDVERAKADLRVNLDISQRFGNGLGTRLDADDQAIGQSSPSDRALPTNTPAPSSIEATSVETRIKLAKLEQVERANRNALIADEIAKGTLIKAADARAEMSKMASTILVMVEGSLTNIATGLAAKFKLPHRDVLHEIRFLFRAERTNMAKKSRDDAASRPETVETVIHAEDDPETETSAN